MKLRPILLLAVAFTGMVAMGSCTKNYTCQCVISYTGQPGLPDSVVQNYTIKDTKKGAKSKCTANSDTYSNNNINTTERCYLY